VCHLLAEVKRECVIPSYQFRYAMQIQLAGVFVLNKGAMSCQKAHNTVVTTKLINSSSGPNVRPPTKPKLMLATITTAKKIP
jgi:hypothetical protein